MKNILSLGAGVQSTTVLLMSIRGKLPRLDAAIFADVGWEPMEVYSHLEFLKSECIKAEIPLHVVSAGNLRKDLLTTSGRYVSMPLFVRNPDGSVGIVRRQCTKEYKIIPITKKIRELCDVKPRSRPKAIKCTQWFGIGWDETQRMRDSQTTWIKNFYPLIDLRMGRRECLEWNQQYGYPVPPRSACIGCPFHSQIEWRRIKDNPDEWKDACEFDDLIRSSPRFVGRSGNGKAMRGQIFLHRSCIPLRDVDLRTDFEKGQGSLFDNECSGHCGV